MTSKARKGIHETSRSHLNPFRLSYLQIILHANVAGYPEPGCYPNLPQYLVTVVTGLSEDHNDECGDECDDTCGSTHGDSDTIGDTSG